MPDATQAPAVRRFGAFEINLQSGELRKCGVRLRLSGQPFQILAVLVGRPGEVVSREELHSKLWRSDTFVDFDARPATVPPSAAESEVSPTHEITRAVASDAPVPPTEKRFSSARLRVLLGGIAVLALFTVTLLLYWSRNPKGPKLPAIKSLAVLPLKNLSGDPTQEYLADGMTEALIGRLSGIHDLRVISGHRLCTSKTLSSRCQRLPER
jgi:hypothetical protein